MTPEHLKIIQDAFANNLPEANRQAANALMAYATVPDMDRASPSMFAAAIESHGKAIHDFSYMARQGVEVQFDKVAAVKLYLSEPIMASPFALLFENMTTSPGTEEVELLKITPGDSNRFDTSNPVPYGATAISRTIDNRKHSFRFERFAELIKMQPHEVMRDLQGAMAMLATKVGMARTALQLAAILQQYSAVIEAPPSLLTFNPSLGISDTTTLTKAAVCDMAMFVPAIETSAKPISTVALNYFSMTDRTRLGAEFALQRLKDMMNHAVPTARMQDIITISPKSAAILERYGPASMPAVYENGKYALMERDGRYTDGGIDISNQTYEMSAIQAYRQKVGIAQPSLECSEWFVMPKRAAPKAMATVGTPELRSLDIYARAIKGECEASWKCVQARALMENLEVLDQRKEGKPFKKGTSGPALVELMKKKDIKPVTDSNGLPAYDPFYTWGPSAVSTSTPTLTFANHAGAVSDAFLSEDDIQVQARNMINVVLRDWLTEEDRSSISAMVEALMDNANVLGRDARIAAGWAWAFANSGTTGSGVASGSELATNAYGFYDLPRITPSGRVAVVAAGAGANVFSAPVVAGDGAEGAVAFEVKLISNDGRFRIPGASTPQAAHYLAELSMNGVPASWAAYPGFTGYLAKFERGWKALETMVAHLLRLSPTSSSEVANYVLNGQIIPGGPEPGETDASVIAVSGLITALTGGLAVVWVNTGSDLASAIAENTAKMQALGYTGDALPMLAAYQRSIDQGLSVTPVPEDEEVVGAIAGYLTELARASDWAATAANSNNHKWALSSLASSFQAIIGSDLITEADFALRRTINPVYATYSETNAAGVGLKRTRLGLDYSHFVRVAPLRALYTYGKLDAPTVSAGSGDFRADLAAVRSRLHDTPYGRSRNSLPREYRTEALLWERRAPSPFADSLVAPAMVNRVRRLAARLDGTAAPSAMARLAFLLYAGAPMAGTAMGCMAAHGIASPVRAVLMTRLQLQTEMAFLARAKSGISFSVKYQGDVKVQVGKNSALQGNFTEPIPVLPDGSRVTPITTQVTSAVSPTGETFIEMARVTGCSIISPEGVLAMPWAIVRNVQHGDFSFSPSERRNYIVSYMGLSEEEAGYVAPMHGFRHACNVRIPSSPEGFTPPFSGLPLTMASTSYASTFDRSHSGSKVNLGGEQENAPRAGLGLMASDNIMALNSYRGVQGESDASQQAAVTSERVGCSPLSHVIPASPAISLVV